MTPASDFLMRSFFQTYTNLNDSFKVVEVGPGASTAVKDFLPPDVQYTSVDTSANANPTILLDDPYTYPIDAGSVDVVICTSVLDQSDMFWLVFNESLRILKDDGLLYINAPSAGRWQMTLNDSWRFYPESGRSLVKWGKKSGFQSVALVESFLFHYDSYWNDFAAVFIKDETHIAKCTTKIIDGLDLGIYSNASLYGRSDYFNVDPDFENRRDNYKQL